MELSLKNLQLLVAENEEYLNRVIVDEVQPLLGCTDITIVALGTALAAQAVYEFIPQWVDPDADRRPFTKINPEEVISISIQMNEGLYKNSHATAIPNSGGHSGIVSSAALALFSNPEKKLNLFTEVDEKQLENMDKIIAKTRITVETIQKPACNLYLRCRVTLQGKEGLIIGESWLEDSYTRVVSLKRNGKQLYERTEEPTNISDWEIPLDIPILLQALQNLTPEAYQRLEETVELNSLAYEYGLKHAPGLGIGRKFNRLIQKNLIGSDAANQAAWKTAAAEDVRMGGENIAVMGIASSGSHGIASSIPVIAVAQEIPKNRQRLFQSIALSFWITQKVNSLTGFLSVPCGCVIKSGIGVTAGITYYLGGTISQIEQAINNFIISMAGVLCDGGKTTCSIKLANSASTAVQSALLALEGVQFANETGGLVRENMNQNVKNMIQISKSMQNVDSTIIEILKGY
ncbi:MAG: L-serine ammonia-lyase, iron-sulfur-dependent, subunit alpha [Candidatus Hodarchaeales archaeon]|jgi:L-cysteine desulfidase